jgi:uncharacterized membrane protein SirB2
VRRLLDTPFPAHRPLAVIEHFPFVRSLHVAAALTSGALFALRGLAMWHGSNLGMSAPVRWASYAIDTVLLAAAVTLAYWLHRVPFVDHWVTTKVVLVTLYVVLGSLALKRAPTPATRRLSLVLALLAFLAVYLVARDHGAARWGLAAGP